MNRRAVFLDRDGVLIRTDVRDGVPHPVASLDRVEILPGVAEALDALASRGFLLVGVTNQPDVARGAATREAVEAINGRLLAALPLLEIRTCFHDTPDDCACRKPRPGLLLDAARAHGIELARSFMVGDRWSDVAAGQAAGCLTLLLDVPYNQRPRCHPDHVVPDLPAAADVILDIRRERGLPGGQTPVTTTNVPSVKDLKVKIFADGADKAGILEMARRSWIAGFTTNPTLMRKAGIADYRAFAKDILASLTDRPISFEVFSDEFDEMERQAREIASWGANVYVKIPVTNTRREPATRLIQRLSADGVRLNVTALMTLTQVSEVSAALGDGTPACISVFAGRIADTGRDPVPLMEEAVRILRRFPKQELIWASPRELLNIFQADQVGCHIITVTNDVLKKLDLVGKDLDDYSLDTVKMFHDDAKQAGFSLA